MNEKILITGGAGYIGSHTLLALMRAGYSPVVLDNFSNSSPEVLRRVEYLAGAKLEVVSGDIRDARLLDRIFSSRARPVDLYRRSSTLLPLRPWESRSPSRWPTTTTTSEARWLCWSAWIGPRCTTSSSVLPLPCMASLSPCPTRSSTGLRRPTPMVGPRRWWSRFCRTGPQRGPA